MPAYEFDLESGALCLDFANTAQKHASPSPVELLINYAVLTYWAESAAILSPERAQVLRQLAESQPHRAAQIHTGAIQLREAIYRIFSASAEKSPVARADLALLNQALNRAFTHLQVSEVNGSFAWEWHASPQDLDQMIWPVARSAAELLASEKLSRTRRCADDRGCGYLFIDTSRNRSRRWCSMNSCGNRAKARRFYQNK